MATLSVDRFQQLLETLRPNPPAPDADAAPPAAAPAPRNDPSALGPIAPCSLGKNKMTKLTKFEEWLEEAENRMDYITKMTETKSSCWSHGEEVS